MEYIEENDYKCTKFNGKFHSYNDLHAIIFTNGNRYWYKEGRIHRYNSLPAIIRTNNSAEWWIDGVMIKKCTNYQQ